MKLYGNPRRIELKPETDEEREIFQRIVDGKALIYWGDSAVAGGALIINSHQTPRPPVVGSEPIY